MTHKRIVLALVTMSLSSASFAQSSGLTRKPARDTTARRVGRTRTVRAVSPIRALLAGRIEKIDWQDKPLGEVFDWLGHQSIARGKVNILPRWRALDRESINSETVVTLELEQVTVAAILEEVFDQLSGLNPMVYVGRGNILKITTRSDLRADRFTRAYDIAEIIAQAQYARVSPRMNVGQQQNIAGATANQGGIGVNSGTFNIGATLFGDFGRNDDDRDDRDLGDEFVEQLIEMIQTTVLPKSWRVNGGDGDLSVFDGSLMVYNSADVHALLGAPFLVSN